MKIKLKKLHTKLTGQWTIQHNCWGKSPPKKEQTKFQSNTRNGKIINRIFVSVISLIWLKLHHLSIVNIFRFEVSHDPRRHFKI